MTSGSFTIVRVNSPEYSAFAEVTTPNTSRNQEFTVGWATNEKITQAELIERVRSAANILKIDPGTIYLAL